MEGMNLVESIFPRPTQIVDVVSMLVSSPNISVIFFILTSHHTHRHTPFKWIPTPHSTIHYTYSLFCFTFTNLTIYLHFNLISLPFSSITSYKQTPTYQFFPFVHLFLTSFTLKHPTYIYIR